MKRTTFSQSDIDRLVAENQKLRTTIRDLKAQFAQRKARRVVARGRFVNGIYHIESEKEFVRPRDIR